MNEELKEQSIIFTDEYRDIEAKIRKEISAFEIDRSLPYDQQGMMSHAHEMAVKKVNDILTKVRKEKEQRFLPKPSYK
jgi:hypothetical protein